MHPLEKRVSELWTVVGREGLYSWMGGVCLGPLQDLKGCSRSLEDGQHKAGVSSCGGLGRASERGPRRTPSFGRSVYSLHLGGCGCGCGSSQRLFTSLSTRDTRVQMVSGTIVPNVSRHCPRSPKLLSPVLFHGRWQSQGWRQRLRRANFMSGDCLGHLS